MPGGNGTGPMGMGPMTGRGMGYCAGLASPGYSNYGFGRGMGRGRGYRKMYYATGMPGFMRDGAYASRYVPFASQPAEVSEKEFLQKQVDFLENQLKQVREQLSSVDEKE